MQVNHLGPYTLTRLLEPKLLASAARVVFVSSIVHRFAAIRWVNHGLQLDLVFALTVLLAPTTMLSSVSACRLLESRYAWQGPLTTCGR